MLRAFFRPGRALLASVVLGLGLLAGPFSSHPASAGLITCDTDPTITLSNGQTIAIDAQIQSDISTVSQVNYTLYLPQGLSVVRIAYDQYGSVENLSLAPTPFNHYALSTTVVTTTGSAVPVQAHMTVSGAGSNSASGWSGRPIWLMVW